METSAGSSLPSSCTQGHNSSNSLRCLFFSFHFVSELGLPCVRQSWRQGWLSLLPGSALINLKHHMPIYQHNVYWKWLVLDPALNLGSTLAQTLLAEVLVSQPRCWEGAWESCLRYSSVMRQYGQGRNEPEFSKQLWGLPMCECLCFKYTLVHCKYYHSNR